MAKKVLVSKALIDLLEEMANDVMHDPDIGVEQTQDWLNENRSSQTSREKGGIIELEGDHDWKLAFVIWYYAERKISQKLPRA